MNSTIFRKIMVATDGSEPVRKAVDSAIEIAKLSEAKLYAVHVIALGDYYSDNSFHRCGMGKGNERATHNRR